MNFYILFLLTLFNVIITLKCQLCMSLNNTNLEEIWEQYKNMFDKNYKSFIDKRRKSVWMKNCEKIRKHNEEAENGIHNFMLNSNHLADMTKRMYHRKMIKLIRSIRRDVLSPEEVGSFHMGAEKIPEEFDWRDKGFHTIPYSQKDCGSCYAFSIAHSIQAQIFKRTNISEPLSEQQIIDCSYKTGNHGCAGGSLRNTLRYLDHSGGLMTAKDYPYVARQTKCKFNKNKVVVNLTSWAILPPRDERTMQRIVAKIGPVAASINASPHTFQLYKSGIYDDISCSSSVVNHAMLIMGYTKDAWILKNWWGNHWGEGGYMRLKRNKNQCGISNYVAYVTV